LYVSGKKLVSVWEYEDRKGSFAVIAAGQRFAIINDQAGEGAHT
jgi:hypothetical protein